MLNYIVAIQEPHDEIIHIVDTPRQAKKLFDKLPDSSCPIWYSCDADMLKTQSGYKEYEINNQNKSI